MMARTTSLSFTCSASLTSSSPASGSRSHAKSRRGPTGRVNATDGAGFRIDAAAVTMPATSASSRAGSVTVLPSRQSVPACRRQRPSTAPASSMAAPGRGDASQAGATSSEPTGSTSNNDNIIRSTATPSPST